MRVRHLLAKHVGSRRASSWREERITRSLDEAKVPPARPLPSRALGRRLGWVQARVAAFREQIVRGEAKFDELAKVESDCSSAKKGGDLGFFEHGRMQPAFADASFALKVGEISELVVSDSGVHIIERMG